MLCGMVALSAQNVPVPDTCRYTIGNSVVPFDESGVKPNKSGYEFWHLAKQFTQSGLYVKMTYVDKDSALHPPHRHEAEEFYYILEGEAIVTVGDRESVVGPLTCVYCPPNVYHGIRRANDQPLRYLVVHT